MPAATDPSQPSARTPTRTPKRSSSYFSYPVSYAVSGILRRLNTDTSPEASRSPPDDNTNTKRQSQLAATAASLSSSFTSFVSGASIASFSDNNNNNMDSVFRPAHRMASPFQPPPLTPLTLSGYRGGMRESGKLLSKALAEEIRLLLPPRLQLVDDWNLIYSLEQNGVSLATLYAQADDYRGVRGGFVLVVKDGGGGIFGAYLSDAPHPASHFYGNGECFLWRAHVLKSLPDLINLPPPPSADTTHATRMTTLSAAGAKADALSPPVSGATSRSGTTTPESIRFKAFPYSGVNDYMIFCEQDFLSVGGGDGHYGLWLDDSLENGVSATCPTFGNEPLSDNGSKFDVMGVELWYIG